MSIHDETMTLFAVSSRLHKELATLRASLEERGAYCTSDPAYESLSAMCSAVSLAANLGVLSTNAQVRA